MDYWVDDDKEYAISYRVYGSNYYWIIGMLEEMGTYATIYSFSDILEQKCPNNEGHVWSWNYYDGTSYVATNDVGVKCANEGDFCTSVNPCKEDEGDCDLHDECQESLVCGSSNCPTSLGFDLNVDCCSISDNRRKKNPRENIHKLPVPKHSGNVNKMSSPKHFDGDNKILLFSPYFRNHPMQYQNVINHDMERSRIKRNIKQHKAKIIATKSNSGHQTNLPSHCGGNNLTYENSPIVCNHLASSVYGLIVVLNPNEAEYGTDALKNNFVGFKTLVHSPYDYPEVDAVGMAMDQNIQSFIGIRGYHSGITEAADRWKPDQKKCASRDDIELDVFEDYTRKNCVFECQAKGFFDKCGCVPYYYPDFHLAWEGVNSSTCNITGLLCLSRVPGRLNLSIILSKKTLIFFAFT